MAESIAEFLLKHFREHAREYAYTQRRGYRTAKVTYGEVLNEALRFADELERRDIAKSDRIMLWAENSAKWASVFFSCALQGIVVVPMDDGASPDFVRRVCAQVGAKLVVASHRNRAAIGNAPAPALAIEDLSGATGSPERTTGAHLPGRDDILEIVFTSGTTAEPKGVVITHGNVLANLAPLEKEIRGYLKYERFAHPVRFLNLLPLSHVFGQFMGLFLPPLMGGTGIFQSELKPSEVLNTIRREHVSVLVSVPRVLQTLKHKVERDIEDRGLTEIFHRHFVAAKDKHFLKQ